MFGETNLSHGAVMIFSRIARTHLMINRNMAQKHMSTAKTDSMLENSATDTSIAVMATNITADTTTALHYGTFVASTRDHGRKRESTTIADDGVTVVHLYRPVVTRSAYRRRSSGARGTTTADCGYTG